MQFRGMYKNMEVECDSPEPNKFTCRFVKRENNEVRAADVTFKVDDHNEPRVAHLKGDARLMDDGLAFVKEKIKLRLKT